MNYRHGYHAGSFADVFKHLITINIIEILLRKEKPFCYLDTHAGRGIYHLHSNPMPKSRVGGGLQSPQESSGGIGKIINCEIDKSPLLVQKYLEIVKGWKYPKYYPGSPAIAKTLLRDSDHLILTELQTEEFKFLKENFKNNKNVAAHHLNGYQGLKAFLPPKERRGFILIDPPFEKTEEWNTIIEGLKEGIKKFSSGVYAIWYPIKDAKSQVFLNSIYALKLQEVLTVELSIYPKDVPLKLIGCGMLILNPPWPLKKEIQSWLPWLWERLAVNRSGDYHIYTGSH